MIPITSDIIEINRCNALYETKLSKSYVQNLSYLVGQELVSMVEWIKLTITENEVARKKALSDNQIDTPQGSQQVNVDTDSSDVCLDQFYYCTETEIPCVMMDIDSPATCESKFDDQSSSIKQTQDVSTDKNLPPTHVDRNNPLIFFYASTTSPFQRSIEFYVDRITTYLDCSADTLIATLVYMDRWVTNMNSEYYFWNVHCLFLTSFLCAQKYWEDAQFPLKDVALVGEISCFELKCMEIEFLRILQFDFLVSTEQFLQCVQTLCSTQRQPDCLHKTCKTILQWTEYYLEESKLKENPNEGKSTASCSAFSVLPENTTQSFIKPHIEESRFLPLQTYSIPPETEIILSNVVSNFPILSKSTTLTRSTRSRSTVSTVSTMSTMSRMRQQGHLPYSNNLAKAAQIISC